jgi:putative hydrolase of the HAD superfamily
MEKHCLERILHYLETARILQPEPTGVTARLDNRHDIRAVIFDIYGTLLVSTSGDIDEAEFSSQHVLTALDECGIDACRIPPEDLAGQMLDEYRAQIHRIHAEKHRAGIPWPEIDIREVWQDVFTMFRSSLVLPEDPVNYDTSLFSILFESFSNPVCAMPGLHETITRLHASGIPLGLISNAQFYTPIILEYFLTGRFDDSGIVSYFDTSLCAYSYMHGRAKPDIMLFEACAQRLHDIHGINAASALYVGNDMLKDILPAHETGFNTALFAGDARSLRMHSDDPACTTCTPGYVITRLDQLNTLIKAA